MQDVVIVDSVRTGLSKAFRGSFNLTRSDDLLAHCIDSLLDRNPNVSADEVEDVYVGAASMSQFHELNMLDIEGNKVDFADYAGKTCLVVNVASA